MKFERFDKKITPDPSISSIREEALNLKKRKILKIFPSKDNIYIDKNTKERFFKIREEANAKQQRVIALLLKGIINVADVVKYKNDYFSHQYNINSVKSDNEGKFLSEIDADILILREVFDDGDKLYREEWSRPGVGGWTEYRNMSVSNSEKKKYYFDFHVGFNKSIIVNNNLDLKSNEEEKFRMKIKEILKEEHLGSEKIIPFIVLFGEHAPQRYASNDSKEILILTKQKINLLLDRFHNKEFFVNVMKKPEYEDPLGNDIRFQDITKRLEIIKEIIDEEIGKSKE